MLPHAVSESNEHSVAHLLNIRAVLTGEEIRTDPAGQCKCSEGISMSFLRIVLPVTCPKIEAPSFPPTLFPLPPSFLGNEKAPESEVGHQGRRTSRTYSGDPGCCMGLSHVAGIE
mgnify:CR=1 FL=1